MYRKKTMSELFTHKLDFWSILWLYVHSLACLFISYKLLIRVVKSLPKLKEMNKTVSISRWRRPASMNYLLLGNS